MRQGRAQPPSAGALIARLWRSYLRPHRMAMALAFALMVIEGSTLGLLSWMLEPLFDRVFVGGDLDAMWWVGGAILGLFVVRAVTGVSQRVILTAVAQRSSTRMQTDLLAHVMTLDTLFFQTNPPGALIERVQGDTRAVQDVWQTLILGVGRDAVALVSLLVVAILIDPLWTAVAFVGAPLLILPSMVLQRYVRRKTAATRVEASRRATRLDEVFHGIAAVKLNRLEGYQTGRFREIVDRIVRAEVRTAAGRAMLPGLIDIMTGLGLFGVLILGGREIVSGDKTVGQFMSFFTAMALAFQPLRRLGGIAGVLQVAAASLERLFALFDIAPTILGPARPRAVVADTTIAFHDVCLAYGGLPALDGVRFVARAGRTTAIVGASGAGKSTIFNVLTRLVDPQSGRVTIGGLDTREIDLAALRDLFSVVSQDSALFDDTLRENILLGRRDVDAARLAEVLDAAHVTEFVAALPDGLDTAAGPRGANLSGGQRQRIAIARALLRDRPILLLDEATSALDSESESAVQAALERLSARRTTLVIAHRLATVRSADTIVALNRGRVVETGTHEELLAQGGLYAELYRLQFAA